MTDPFVSQLAQLARSERTANKWILVPTHSIGWTLGERLVREGCDWVNLRFTTPFQLALDAAAPDLVAAGTHPCPENLGPSLLKSLLLESHPLILQPGMAEALWATLREARMAGVCPGDYEARYLRYLEEHRLADRAMLFRHGAATKVRTDDFVLAYPYHVWQPLELEFIGHLPGQHLRPHGTDRPAPRRLRDKRFPCAITATCEKRFFYAGRRDLEFQEIVSRIEGPLDEVEIAAHTEDLPLLHDILTAQECPATFEEGLPIGLSRPAQGLAGFLEWMESGWSGFHARELLMANLMKAVPNSWTAARLVGAARIGWGRQDYGRKLEALAHRAEAEGAEWLKLQAGQARALAGWFGKIFKLFPEGPLDLHQFLRGLQTMLEFHLDSDEQATPVLKWALEELKLLPSGGWSLDQALRLVRDRLREVRWGTSRSRPGHVHVTSLNLVGLSGRRRCFLTGLEEGRSAIPPEDCILSDAQRRLLHPGLALAADRFEERQFHIEERMATLSGEVTFSFSSRNREGDQEQLPSWLFFREARNQNPELDSVSKLIAWLGEPAQPWLREERESRRGPTAAVLDLYPDLKRGQVAEEARASEQFTVYDGHVAEAAGLWERMTFSVSRLQALAACPFQFFLTKGLGLYPAPLPLPDPDRWLDAATRGHILHEIYALHSRAQREGRVFDVGRGLDEILATQLPPPSVAVEKVEREALRRDVEHFFKLEAERPGRVQVGVEVGFGLGAEAEPLSRPQPLLLDLGAGVQLSLNGRIDRIDRLPRGYSVVDYKTGKKLELASKGLYQQGTLLQHALYALAAEFLVEGPVVESGYYFTSAHASLRWVPFDSPDLVQLRQVVELVLHPLRVGVFPHTAKDCGFCDFKAACQSHRDPHTVAKLADPLLEPRRRLLEVR